MMLPFICLVVSVTDGDTLRCADQTRIRIAAVNAREKDDSCRRGSTCPQMRHHQAKPIVERMVLGRELKCRRVDVSYRRIVADCTLPDGRSLSCALVRTGAVVWQPGYARRYRMGCHHG
jgi:endonuclease YncB( thermonuclease family)